MITDLDDTCLLYMQLRPLLIRPHLKFLVARITESHMAIADELVGQMARTRGLAARRGGGILAGLRAKIEKWVAIASLDIEVGCLKRVARHEIRVTQRFRETLEHVKGLNQNLHRELCELERACLRIETLTREMELPSLAVARRPTTASRLSTHQGPRS